MNKQIEEMAKDIYESKSCDTSFEENCKLLAYDLVTLGYQKVDTNSVILTKGAYESLSSKAKANVVNAVEIRKETAREILTELLDFVNGWFEGVENNDFGVEFNRISKDFAEKYGVEIKE